MGFRVVESKKEDHCDIPNLLLRSTSNYQVTKHCIKFAKGKNSELKPTSNPR